MATCRSRRKGHAPGSSRSVAPFFARNKLGATGFPTLAHGPSGGMLRGGLRRDIFHEGPSRSRPGHPPVLVISSATRPPLGGRSPGPYPGVHGEAVVEGPGATVGHDRRFRPAVGHPEIVSRRHVLVPRASGQAGDFLSAQRPREDRHPADLADEAVPSALIDADAQRVIILRSEDRPGASRRRPRVDPAALPERRSPRCSAAPPLRDARARSPRSRSLARDSRRWSRRRPSRRPRPRSPRPQWPLEVRPPRGQLRRHPRRHGAHRDPRRWRVRETPASPFPSTP